MKENQGRQNNGSPKMAHMVIPGTCEYVTLHSKREFVGGIKLRTLRWGNYPGSSGGPNIMTRALIRGRQEGQGDRK